MSIKNNVAISVFHIQKSHNIISKSVHHAINVNSTEAELFAIKYRIDQATKIHNASKIFIITDTIPAAKWIFDTLIHPYQLHLIALLKSLREFFNKNSDNLISFWDCPSSIKWSLHTLVDKESKHILINPILPSRMSWEFSRKEECDSIIPGWEDQRQQADGKWCFKLPITKEETFLALIMTKENIFILHIQKKMHGWNTIAFLIHYVYASPEWSLITHL